MEERKEYLKILNERFLGHRIADMHHHKEASTQNGQVNGSNGIQHSTTNGVKKQDDSVKD